MSKELKDELETMILMLMDGKHGITTNAKNGNKDIDSMGNKKKKFEYITYDISEMTSFDDMSPSSTYVANVATDQGREIAIKPEWLLAHPADIVGDGLEVSMFHNGYVKWMGYRKCRRSPKGIAAVGVPAIWLESHFRFIFPNGQGRYMKNYVPVSKNGNALFAKMGRVVMCDPIENTLNLTAACSLYEDAHRTNTMLVSVTDSVELKLAVGLDCYKEIFALRDAPMTAAGRRKAILHWVASHLRKSVSGTAHQVQSYTRGASEICMDGIRIRLEPNHQPMLAVS